MTDDHATTVDRDATVDHDPIGIEELDAALAAIHDAQAGVEASAQRLETARRDFGRRLAAFIGSSGDVPEGLVRDLYWRRREVRVSDIAAGLGIGTQQVSGLAGPIEVETRCRACDRPYTREQRSRSQTDGRICPDCDRDRWGVGPALPDDPWPDDPWADDPRPGDRLSDDLSTDDRLHAYLARTGCDGTLRGVRRWALLTGRDPVGVVAAVEEWGAFCDCEVLFNVPDHVLW